MIYPEIKIASRLTWITQNWVNRVNRVNLVNLVALKFRESTKRKRLVNQNKHEGEDTRNVGRCESGGEVGDKIEMPSLRIS